MTRPYALMSGGFDYSPVAEDEFNDWYDTEHVPERARIEGFITALRWVGAYNPRISIATYDLESLDVLKHPDYVAVSGVNFSPWAKRVIGKCIRICRFEAEQIIPGRQAGPIDANGLFWQAVNVAPEAEAEFNKWYNEEHLPRLSAVSGCVCARRFKIVDGSHRYLATFHLTSPEVEASSAWKTASETPMAAKMRGYVRDELRFVLRRYVRKTPTP
jgi:hypothetical protein